MKRAQISPVTGFRENTLNHRLQLLQNLSYEEWKDGQEPRVSYEPKPRDPDCYYWSLKLIEMGMRSGIGINKDQCHLIGLPYPPEKGWKSRLVGTKVKKTVFKRYLALNGLSRKSRASLEVGGGTALKLDSGGILKRKKRKRFKKGEKGPKILDDLSNLPKPLIPDDSDPIPFSQGVLR